MNYTNNPTTELKLVKKNILKIRNKNRNNISELSNNSEYTKLLERKEYLENLLTYNFM